MGDEKLGDRESMVAELAFVKMHEPGLSSGGTGLQNAGFVRSGTQSKSGKPRADSSGSDHDDFVARFVEVGNRLRKPSEHGVMKLTAGFAGENSGANFDDDTLSCSLIAHGMSPGNWDVKGRDDMATSMECKGSVFGCG